MQFILATQKNGKKEIRIDNIIAVILDVATAIVFFLKKTHSHPEWVSEWMCEGGERNIFSK